MMTASNCGVLRKSWVVLAVVTGMASHALAAPSWNSSPTWAQGGSASSSGARRKQTNKNIYSAPSPSPFAPDSSNFALDVGQVFLLGDLGNRYNDNLGLQLHYTYGVSDIFGFDSSFGYSSHSAGAGM